MIDWRAVPLPKQMRALAKDKRGYPIPFTVLRDNSGCPHFTVNDGTRQHKAVTELRCAICGGRMAKPYWFVGGIMSAFHEDGAYVDTALHHDCMTYALQVCPYLSMPNYLGRIDDATVDPARLRDVAIAMNTMVIPGRPTMFVAVAANSQTVIPCDDAPPVVKPNRPYVAVEFWKNGRQLSEEDGHVLVALAFTEGEQCTKR